MFFKSAKVNTGSGNRKVSQAQTSSAEEIFSEAQTFFRGEV